MQRNLVRAWLLAMAVLLLGAVPAAAQIGDRDEDGLFLRTESGSFLVGIENDVDVGAGESADGILIIDGTATVEGDVSNIAAFDADVVITGSSAMVEGILTVGGTLTVDDGATVENITYVDSEITLGETAVVDPDNVVDATVEIAGAFAWIAAALLLLWIGIWIGTAIALLAASLLTVAFGTSQLRRAAFNIGNDILKTLVAGFLMVVVPWLLIVVLGITIVGLPLAIGLAVVWLFVAFLGYLTVGLWIGERILSRARTAERPYGAAFLGVLILMLLSWVPLVTPVALWFGLGAVSLAGWRVLRGGGVPPVPPGYGQPYGQPMQVPPPPYAPPPYAPPPPPQGQWPPQGGPPTSWPQG
jgi:hypothetical protein